MRSASLLIIHYSHGVRQRRTHWLGRKIIQHQQLSFSKPEIAPKHLPHPPDPCKWNENSRCHDFSLSLSLFIQVSYTKLTAAPKYCKNVSQHGDFFLFWVFFFFFLLFCSVSVLVEWEALSFSLILWDSLVQLEFSSWNCSFDMDLNYWKLASCPQWFNSTANTTNINLGSNCNYCKFFFVVVSFFFPCRRPLPQHLQTTFNPPQDPKVS